MNLQDSLKLLAEKLGVDGIVAVLGVPKGLAVQYVSGKKKPGLDACQKLLDWSSSQEVKTDDLLDTSYEEDITNMSYCPAEWGRKKAAWDGRDVCLCIPTYGPVPEVPFFGFMCLAMKYRMAIRLEHRGGDSMIARSRNQLAKRFLATNATWSIWLDSDMIFPFGNSGSFATLTGMKNFPDKFGSFHVVERLISHGRTMVGGCYWDRMGRGKLIAGGKGPILSPIPSDTLAAVSFVGTGCLAVHRKVFEDVAAKFPETLSEDAYGNETGFFTPIQTPERMLGEDESFAWRATEAGHPTFLDLGLICGHVGTAVHSMPEKGSRI